MSTTTTEPPKSSPPTSPAEPLVPLRDRLLQSDKARTQGAGSGQDRDVSKDMSLRRNIVWGTLLALVIPSIISFCRFFFPRTLFEPKTRFSIGYPTDYALGVDTKWQQEKRVWVVRDAQGIFVIFAKCTHLGCTPDWKDTDNKFKCPCHGSGFDMEGVNFEGPAPRPLDRCYVELDPQGRIIVDKAILFPEEKWTNPKSRILA